MPAHLSKEFYIKLQQMAAKFGIPAADFLLFFTSESGLDPSAGGTSTAGLNQMLPSVLKTVNWDGDASSFSKLPADKQIPYIERFFDLNFKWVGKPKNATDLYLENFVPAAMLLPDIQAGKDSAVIAENYPKTRGSIPQHGTYYGHAPVSPQYEVQIYNSNSGFDNDHDGKITYGDLRRHLEAKRSDPRYQEALKEYMEATGSSATQSDSKDNTPKEDSKEDMPASDNLDSLYEQMKKEVKKADFDKLSYIRQIGKNKYRVYSEKGKNMGTYPSRDGAKKRLRQIEYFKHNKADDGKVSKEVDLSGADEMTYSAIMREAKKKQYFGFLSDFADAYKAILDKLYVKDGNPDDAISHTMNILKKKYKIITVKKEATVEVSYQELGRAIANVILFLASRIKPENRTGIVAKMVRRIYYINDAELASKHTPPGAVFGQAITLIKTVLRDRDPGFIRLVINEVIKYLSYAG